MKVLLLILALSSTCHAIRIPNPIRQFAGKFLQDEDQTSSNKILNQIKFLRPNYAVSGLSLRENIDCLSWRLAVETNNIRDWSLVPQDCENYMGHYVMGKQYRHDCEQVVKTAIEYAKTVAVAGDGKDIWVFDIDETSLSNAPYYARSDVQFGSLPYNDTKFNAWVAEGVAPAVPGMVNLYNNLYSLGFKVVFLSGTKEAYRKPRISNLKRVGYKIWEKLILKGPADSGEAAVVYKSKKRTELVEVEGYRIIGNVGDQWSDLLGTNVGKRTFKIPDPLYYIA